MQRLNLLVKFLQTKEGVVFALLGILLAQLTHSVEAFVAMSVETGIAWVLGNIVTGTGFAVGLSATVLILTLFGKKNFAYVFVAIEVIINFTYYELYNLDLSDTSQLRIAVMRLIFSFIIPFAIAVYSDIVNEIKSKEAVVESNSQEEIKHLHEELEKLYKYAEEQQLSRKEIEKEVTILNKKLGIINGAYLNKNKPQRLKVLNREGNESDVIFGTQHNPDLDEAIMESTEQPDPGNNSGRDSGISGSIT